MSSSANLRRGCKLLGNKEIKPLPGISPDLTCELRQEQSLSVGRSAHAVFVKLARGAFLRSDARYVYMAMLQNCSGKGLGGSELRHPNPCPKSLGITRWG
jgi:hypothetical protein